MSSKIKTNEIQFKGNTFKYKTIKDLAKKLNVTQKTANDFKRGGFGQLIIRDTDGNFGRIEPAKKEVTEVLEDFGIKKITNKDLTTGTTLTRGKKGKKRDITIGGMKLTGNKTIQNALIRVRYTIAISDDVSERRLNISYKGPISGISDEIGKQLGKVEEQIAGTAGGGKAENGIGIDITDVSVDVVSQTTGQSFEYDQDKFTLKKMKPIDISNIYDVDVNSGLGCVNRMFRNHTTLKPSFGDSVTRKELSKYCDNKIRLVVYSISGSKLYDNKHDSKKKLSFIDYQGHCYPLLNGKLSRKQTKDIEKIKYCVCDDEIADILEKGKYPYEIRLGNDKKNKILSFVCDGVKYITNDKHKKIKDIITKMAFEKVVIPDNAKTSFIFECIQNNKEKTKDTQSFFPFTYTKSPFNYVNEKKFKRDDIETIDKNKAYSCALKHLKFISSCDYRNAKITKNPTEIIEHNLYIAEPVKSNSVSRNLLIKERGVYSGEHIIYCLDEGIPLRIYEEIDCQRHENGYTDIINMLYRKLDNDDFKECMNISIGKMCQDEDVQNVTNIVGIFDTEEIRCYEGHKIKIDDTYSILMDKCEDVSINYIYNRKPVNIQIKDACNREMYRKIKEMKIEDKNIVQIKTDSISYIGNLPENLDENNIDGWKESDYTKMKCDNQVSNYNPKTFYIDNNSDNKIYNCNAGWGKTTTIKDELIKDMTDYIILTPSHKTMKVYKENKINCDVVQTYVFKNELPTEKNIIIDEIGLFNKESNDVIFKCHLAGKNLIAYGDFDQLMPVGKNGKGDYYNSDQYINMLFSEKIETFINHRNHFTKDYYKSLINEDIDFIEEVRKHGKDKFEDAEMVFCFRNDIVDKYNKLVMKKLKLKDGCIGLKVICKTNALKHKGIYNGFTFTITDNKDGKITLDDKYIITKKQYEHIAKEGERDFFKPNYASTLYGVQGEGYKSYYYAEEDYRFLTTGRMAYTVISRLKTKCI